MTSGQNFSWFSFGANQQTIYIREEYVITRFDHLLTFLNDITNAKITGKAIIEDAFRKFVYLNATVRLKRPTCLELPTPIDSPSLRKSEKD